LNNFLARGSAFLAIFTLALIPAVAQAPHADSIQKIQIRAQAIRSLRSARAGAHALRRA